MNPWDAQWGIDETTARDRIAAAFPSLADRPVRYLSEGWDNTVFRCGPKLLFRFPRRAVAVALLQTEAAVLPLLAPRLACPIPRPLWWCAADADGRPFAGVPWIEGQTVCRSTEALRSRPALAVQLGEFLAALHRIPVEDDLARSVPEDRYGRTDLHRRREVARGQWPLLRRLLGPETLLRVDARLNAWVDTQVPERRTVVHGDLYARHVLLSAQGELAGVIDWGDVHLGSPALDLSVAWTVVPAVHRAAFFRAYGPTSSELLRVAAFRALFHATRTLAYAHDIGDADLDRASRWAIAAVCAEPLSGPAEGAAQSA